MNSSSVSIGYPEARWAAAAYVRCWSTHVGKLLNAHAKFAAYAGLNEVIADRLPRVLNAFYLGNMTLYGSICHWAVSMSQLSHKHKITCFHNEGLECTASVTSDFPFATYKFVLQTINCFTVLIFQNTLQSFRIRTASASPKT